MTVLFLIIMAIIATFLTVWMLAIPVEMLYGTFEAFRHGGMRWRRQ